MNVKLINLKSLIDEALGKIWAMTHLCRSFGDRAIELGFLHGQHGHGKETRPVEFCQVHGACQCRLRTAAQCIASLWNCGRRCGRCWRNYCFYPGVWAGFTGFALVVLLVWTAPLLLGALRMSMKASEVRERIAERSEEGSEDSGEGAERALLQIWSGLSLLWCPAKQKPQFCKGYCWNPIPWFSHDFPHRGSFLPC